MVEPPREPGVLDARTLSELSLLASVTEQLNATLDADDVARRLAELVVPSLADWCVVTLVEDGVHSNTTSSATLSRDADLRRGLRDVASWHRDVELRPLAATYARHRIGELLDDSYLLKAMRQTEALQIGEDATATVSRVLAAGGTASGVLQTLAPQTAAFLPLRGRGRTVGILSLFRGDGPALDANDLTVAMGVANRAGLALDSARQYGQQRDLAAGLQEALLTTLVRPSGLDLAVRYVACAEAAQVGGDWYDVVTQPGEVAVLVIGDVLGHDTRAAAGMSQLRTTVRALAAVDAHTPAQVLARTDQVMGRLGVDTIATALVVRIERSAAGVLARWSTAGHPPAMLVGPDGDVTVLETADPDLMLGLAPEEDRHDDVTPIAPDSTLLLFTDGLFERRGQPLTEGLESLRATLQELCATAIGGPTRLDLDALLDALLGRMLADRPEDDAAVLAVRVR